MWVVSLIVELFGYYYQWINSYDAFDSFRGGAHTTAVPRITLWGGAEVQGEPALLVVSAVRFTPSVRNLPRSAPSRPRPVLPGPLPASLSRWAVPERTWCTRGQWQTPKHKTGSNRFRSYISAYKLQKTLVCIIHSPFYAATRRLLCVIAPGKKKQKQTYSISWALCSLPTNNMGKAKVRCFFFHYYFNLKLWCTGFVFNFQSAVRQR